MPQETSTYEALLSGNYWSDGNATPAVITYSFETESFAVPAFLGQEFADTFSSYNSREERLAERALDLWSNDSGLTFVEVSAGEGDIRFGNYDFSASAEFSEFAGFAYYPSRYNGHVSETSGGIYTSDTLSSDSLFRILLHEIGHVLGLKHPHEGDPTLSEHLDSTFNTVMSYNFDNAYSDIANLDFQAITAIYGEDGFTPSSVGGIQSHVWDSTEMVVTQVWGNASSLIDASSLSDDISGGAGDDSIYGYGGADTLRGGAGNDELETGDADDVLLGGDGQDWLFAGSGADSLQGDAGNDRMFGQGGNDTLHGGDGNDNMAGDGGDDLLIAGDGDDTLTDLDGNDTLEPGAGADDVDGGSGIDWVSYASSSAAVSIDFQQNAYDGGDATGDTLRNIENILGSAFDDVLSDGNDNAVFHAGDGDDTLTGRGGTDTLVGQSGADLILGGDDTDLLFGDAVHDISLSTAHGQIFRLYKATLDRRPDTDGFQNWVSQLENGTNTMPEIAAGFVASAEFQASYGALDDAEFITLLYNNVLGRSPDAAGLADWQQHLSDGASRADIVVGFSDSTEFQGTMNLAAQSYAIRQQETAWSDDVFRLYLATLGRTPDQEGLIGWIGFLADGMAYSSVVSGFVDSAEFEATYGLLDDAGFVSLLYQNVLGRAADDAGQSGWTSQLAGGTTRETVVQGFAQSQEFIDSSRSDLVTWMRDQSVQDRLDGGAGTNTLIAGLMSDQLVFDKDNASNDTVLDLEPWDMLEFRDFGYANAQEVLSNMQQSGESVLFSDQGVTVTFADTSLETITSDMILV